MKKSLTILVFFLVFVFLHFNIAAENKTDSSNNISQAEKVKKIDGIFSSWSKPGSPGAAIAVIEKGELILEKGYGLANLEYDISVTPDTIFHVGSVSKQFTAMAIVLL